MKTSNKIRAVIFVFAFIFLFSPILASADSGPKPSVRIVLPQECAGAYATLLSAEESTGPHSAWDGSEAHAYHDRNEDWGTPYDVWEAFVSYKDADGFYYLQLTETQVEESGECAWRYYPPERFKLLLYFPETDRYLVSGILERYAFHSYFTATVEGGALTLAASYDYTAEAVGFAARLVLTLAAELLLALLIFPRDKRMLIPIVIINVITQVGLNLFISRMAYYNGTVIYVLRYLGLELAVTAVEAAVLWILAPRLSSLENPRRRAVVYTVFDNLCSYVLGYAISMIVPALF